MQSISFIIFLIFLIPFIMSCNVASNPCTNIKEEIIKEKLKIDFEKILEKNEIKDMNLCQVIIQRHGNLNIFYSFPDGKSFIFGDIYRDGEFLTKTALNRIQQDFFKNFKSEMDNIVAFSYKPEGATKYIYMITDPDCPFCEQAKGAVKEWADIKKVEVKVILFPLERIHPQAKDKSIKALCSGMDYQGYLNSKWSGQLCDSGIKKIDSTLALMPKLQISGTPTFVSYNGKRFVGFSPEGLNSIIE